MSTTTSPQEEPGTSWSEDTTPGSDELESLEEIVRHRTPAPGSTKSSIRVQRQPVVRKSRTTTSKLPGPGIPRTVNDYEFSPIAPATHWSLEENNLMTLNYATVKSTSAVQSWDSGYVLGEEMDDDTESIDGNIGGMDEFHGHTPGNMDMSDLKVESPDNVLLGNMQEADSTISASGQSSISPPQMKRPRGRPRKHPIQAADTGGKKPNGRSKTGCRTCRRRKKKCDEAKPHCMNCKKNAVICEGYPEPQLWSAGKGRRSPEEAPSQELAVVHVPPVQLKALHPVIHGVETAGDRLFFQHFFHKLCFVLTFEGDNSRKNAFKDIMLPMAVRHAGLMHSILALSSSNLDTKSPWGQDLLRSHQDEPGTDEKSLQLRSSYHHQEALKELRSDILRKQMGETNTVLAASYGQMVCLVVQSLSDGQRDNQDYRHHLHAYQSLINDSPPDDKEFLDFIKEYFEFHISAEELVCLPKSDPAPWVPQTVNEPWKEMTDVVVHPQAIRLLGVQDGIFRSMSRITMLRNKIRQRIKEKLDPMVDYESLFEATKIDADIRNWQPNWPPGDPRDPAGQLYRQMIWVYLWRTIYPPRSTDWKPNEAIVEAVDDGIKLLQAFPSDDKRLTLLLMPAFIIGCAAFLDHQRRMIREKIINIRAYTGLRNADLTLDVLDAVWSAMDKKDEASWDWQTLADRKKLFFLAT